MKLKKLIYVITILVTFSGFSGCLKQSVVVNNYVNEPAIVRYDGGQMQIETMSDKLFVIPPDYSGSVSEGDSLIVYFDVSSDSLPPLTNYPKLSNFVSQKVHSNVVKITSGNMIDSYKDSISSVSLYYNFVDNVLFFNISQKIDYDQTAGYEMICNSDSDAVATTGMVIKRLYIKSQRHGQQVGKDTTKTISYAFKMDEFVNQFAESKDSILFNINYLSGSYNGKDVYKMTQDSTLVWVLGPTSQDKKIYSLEKSKSSK